jgi:hypothetical protein
LHGYLEDRQDERKIMARWIVVRDGRSSSGVSILEVLNLRIQLSE